MPNLSNEGVFSKVIILLDLAKKYRRKGVKESEVRSQEKMQNQCKDALTCPN